LFASLSIILQELIMKKLHVWKMLVPLAVVFCVGCTGGEDTETSTQDGYTGGVERGTGGTGSDITGTGDNTSGAGTGTGGVGADGAGTGDDTSGAGTGTGGTGQ
jgi:hypothetical protein